MISYEGEKIRLRPVRKSDIEKSIIWKNDPEIRECTLGYRFPVTEVMEDRWYNSILDDQSKTKVIFSIETLEEQNLIGFIHLNQIDWISRTCSFGITIGEKKFHGRGMGRDAMKILFGYAFDCLNLRKISLEVASFNKRALNMYLKFGFSEEGVRKEQVYLQGELYDTILMAIFESDFRKKY